MSKHDFESSEFVDRQSRVRAAMEAVGIDLLLVFHPVNVQYLTGSRAKCYQEFQVLFFTLEEVPLYEDVGDLAKALVYAAPDRMLWASNWTHPSAQNDRPEDAVLLDVLLDWIDDAALRTRVLVDNPATLYGF